MKKLLMVLLLAAAVAGCWQVWQVRMQEQTLPPGLVQSNGRLELERFDVASLYPGRVVSMLVTEGDDVVRDQVIAELSSTQVESQVSGAQAAVQRARELVARAEAGEAQAKQAVARAEAEIAAYREQQKVAKLELGNAQKMRRDKLVSATEVSKRQADHDRASAAVKAAEAARAEARAAVAQMQAQVAEAHAGVAQAQAQVTAATSARDDMQIRTPKDGRVEYRMAEEGSVIAAGSKLVSVLDPGEAFMHIFLPNAQMSALKVGDEARIVLDGVDAVWPATVSFIASEAQFTPKSVETQNEREKLMFKVKLKMPGDIALQHKGLLKGGMTGNGYVRSAALPWPENLAVRLPQ